MPEPGQQPEARIRAAVDEAEVFDDCPVKALGESVEGGRFFFLSKSGKVRTTSHRDLNKPGIDTLFVGHTDWLIENHASVDRKGKPNGGWEADAARSDLLRRCDAVGYFDPDKQIRGPGPWLNDDGELVVHCGDRVLRGTEWTKAGFRDGRYIYPTYPRMMMPPSAPAEAYEVQELMEFLGRWNWRWGECAPRVLIGWIFAALVCGALPWRPHIWVTGGRGQGKSTLESLIFGILGDALKRASDPTGAGVRNKLNGAALPVALDEVEFDPSNRRAQDCIELARIGSTDNQASIVRADPSGGTNSWSIRACFYFTSVFHAPMKPQDRSRITVLELAPLKDSSNKRFVQSQIAKFSKMAPRFHARMISRWDTFQVNLLTYEEALSESFDGRVADQFGTLLAVAETMLEDEAADPREVKEFLAQLDIKTHVDGDDMDDPEECLNRLLSWPADIWRSGDRHTIGSLVADALATPLGETRRALPRLGISIQPPRGNPEYLAIANNHNNIERIYQDTRFALRGWIQAFKRMNGAETGRPTVNFAGVRSRAVFVPIDLIKDPDPPGETPEEDLGDDPLDHPPSGPPSGPPKT